MIIIIMHRFQIRFKKNKTKVKNKELDVEVLQDSTLIEKFQECI